MKRPIAFVAGLVLLPLAGVLPGAHAMGGAACTISGTIDFVPSSTTPEQGVWTIEPGVISCQGLFRAKRMITGPGKFSGSGTYTAATGRAPCLHNVGSGQVEYTIPTTEADNLIQEHHDFVFAGAGAFTTPTLRGTFQIVPPSDGSCLAKPMKATFVAEAVLARLNGLDH